MLTRRTVLMSSIALTAALSGWRANEAFAQVDQLQLFVPAAPGGGWDQTSRTVEQVLKAEKLVGNVQITNVAGAGGTVGLPQFVNQWRNRPNALMVAGMTLVASIISNKSPVKLTQTVPIARLTGEYHVLVVPASSPFKTASDFAAALKADPSKVAVAGGSAAGTDHILLGMIGKALGVPATKLSYVAYSGGGPAQAAILGAHVAAGISNYSEFAEQIKAGKLRALAISSEQRLPGIEVPTLKEQGIDAVLANWRGVFAPPGIAGDRRQALLTLIEKMASSPTWQEELKKRDWTPLLLIGDAYAKFIEEETAKTEGILKDLGLAS
jgi:putative tricarboxylic transport membrane protein